MSGVGIVKKFDPKNKEHVLWLRSINKGMAMVTDGRKCDVVQLMNSNPMGEKVDAVEFAYQHFTLCMKFTNAIFDGTAYIPERQKI
jgi:hypothetical protein